MNYFKKPIFKTPQTLNIYINYDDCFDMTNGLNFKCKTDRLDVGLFYILEFNFINPYCDDKSYKSSVNNWIDLLWDSDAIINFSNFLNSQLKVTLSKLHLGKTLKFKDLFDKKNNYFSYKAYLNNCGIFIIQ